MVKQNFLTRKYKRKASIEVKSKKSISIYFVNDYIIVQKKKNFQSFKIYHWDSTIIKKVYKILMPKFYFDGMKKLSHCLQINMVIKPKIKITANFVIGLAIINSYTRNVKNIKHL